MLCSSPVLSVSPYTQQRSEIGALFGFLNAFLMTIAYDTENPEIKFHFIYSLIVANECGNVSHRINENNQYNYRVCAVSVGYI